MQNIQQALFREERALFGSKNLLIENSVFENGESPLKECCDLTLKTCLFGWKYPLWYCRNILAERSTWTDTARAGVWYSENVTLRDCLVQAPKTFRRCHGLTLDNTVLSRAEETLWHCENVNLKNVTVHGDYFAMNCEGVMVENLKLDGNYGFDGVKNVTIRSSHLVTKDAFWNSENVTVEDSFISGEYLGWNAKNLTLKNCTIESLQGLCYIDNLKLINCRLMHTTFAFEYTTLDASVAGRIDSVLNPASGTLRADEIGELILEQDKIDQSKTVFDANVRKRVDKPIW
ncbi:MAG: DUF3737 family protein [Clostridia bacterium]|nr:DUF3737 family protein [Clostridia bacterium]